LCSVLQAYEYNVLIAVSGPEALRVWDEHEGKIDLVLTDMIMPGRMTGIDLIKELRVRKPGLKVIITSGYSEDLIGHEFNRVDTRFLPKPYETQMVAHLIRKTLDVPVSQPAAASARSAAGVDLNPVPPRHAHKVTHPSGTAAVHATRAASGPAV